MLPPLPVPVKHNDRCLTLANMSTRKQKAVCLERKRNIVNLIQSQKKAEAGMIGEFGLSKTTVNTIWRDRAKYATNFQPFGNNNKKLQHRANVHNVEDALLM